MSSLQCEGGRGWPCTSTAIHNTSEQQAMWVCLFDHCGRGHVMAVRHAAPGFSSERGPGEGQQGMSRMARTRGHRPATASAGVLLLLCSAALIGGAASWSPGNSGIGMGRSQSHPYRIHPHPRPFMEGAERAKPPHPHPASSVAVSGRVPDQLLLSSCSISGSAIQSHSSIILPDLSEQFVMCVDHVVDDQSSGRASGLAVAG